MNDFSLCSKSGFLCPFVLTQKNEKVKSQKKSFVENFLMDHCIEKGVCWSTQTQALFLNDKPFENFLNLTSAFGTGEMGTDKDFFES